MINIYFTNVSNTESLVASLVSIDPNLEVNYSSLDQNMLVTFTEECGLVNSYVKLINCALSEITSLNTKSAIFFENRVDSVSVNLASGVYVDTAIRAICITFYDWKSLGFYPQGNSLIELYRIVDQPANATIRRVDLENAFNAYYSDNDIKHINLVADSGMGKTTLLQQCTQNLEQCYQQLYPNKKNSSNQYWHEVIIDYFNINSTNLDTITADIIDHAKNIQEQIICVIDNLQWIDRFSLSVLRKLVSEVDNLKIITASRFSNDDLSICSQGYKEIEILPFSRSEVIELTEKMGIYLNTESLKFIMNQSQCHPLLLLELLKNVHTHSKSERSLSSRDVKTSRTHYQQLAKQLFYPDNITKFSNELMKLLYLISELHEPVTKNFIEDLIKTLNIDTTFQEFSSLPFINNIDNQNNFFFLHDYYLQAVRVFYELNNNELLLEFAKYIRAYGNLTKAFTLFHLAKEFDTAIAIMLQAADKAYKELNYSDLLEITKVWTDVSWQQISDDITCESMYWYCGYAQDQFGVLELSASYFKSYMYYAKLNRQFLHFFYIPFMCLGKTHFPSYRKLNSSTDFADKATYASRVLTEYSSFNDPPFTVLSYVLRYYLVSQYASSRYETVGEPESYLGITIAPLAGKKRARFWIKKSLTRARSGSDFAKLRSLILRVNYDGYTADWNSLESERRLNRYIKQTIVKQQYKTTVIGYMFKIVFLLCKGRIEKAREILEHHLRLYENKIAKWLKDWLVPVNLAILIEENSPEQVIYRTQLRYPLEIKAGCNVFFASAFMAQNNLSACQKATASVLDNYRQLQYTTHFFSLNIAHLYETTLYLELNDALNPKYKRLLLKACNLHCKLIYRSKPLGIGYKGVRLYAKGHNKKGLKFIDTALVMAQERGNYRAVKLFKLHKKFITGDTSRSKNDWEGMHARLKSLWSTIHRCKRK